MSAKLSKTSLKYLSCLFVFRVAKYLDVVEGNKSSPIRPHVDRYRRKFGGLMYAYPLLGYSKPRVQHWVKGLNIRKAINDELINNVQQRGGSVLAQPNEFSLRVNDELWVSESTARFIITEGRYRRWILGYRAQRKPDILIVARIAKDSDCVRDYFVLPHLLMEQHDLTFVDANVGYLEPFRMDSLLPVFELLARDPLRRMTAGRNICSEQSYDSVHTAKSDAKVLTSLIEDSISSVTNMLRGMFSDRNFVDCVTCDGLPNIPRLLNVPCSALRDLGRYEAASILEFGVIWAFVTRLVAMPKAASLLSRGWPEFLPNMNEVRLSVMTKGPFFQVNGRRRRET